MTLFGQKHNSQRYSVDDKLFSIWYVNTASYSQMTPARILAVNSSLNWSQKVTEFKNLSMTTLEGRIKKHPKFDSQSKFLCKKLGFWLNL